MTEFVVTVALVDVAASTLGVVPIALHISTEVSFQGAATVASVPLPRSGRQVEAELTVSADRGPVGLRWDPVRS